MLWIYTCFHVAFSEVLKWSNFWVKVAVVTSSDKGPSAVRFGGFGTNPSKGRPRKNCFASNSSELIATTAIAIKNDPFDSIFSNKPP